MKLENKKGTSLVELLIYIAIMGIFVASVTFFIISNKKVGDRNETINEVEFQGQNIIEIITQTIRNGQSINLPLLQASSTQLSLTTDVVANSPTVFDLLGGKIRIKKGASSEINLNSDQVIISNLNFKNLGNVGTAGSVSFQFDAQYANPANKSELNYAKTFFGSGSLR